MAVLKTEKQIRLSGDDARNYLKNTGRGNLPKTVVEYNAAHQQSADAWESTGSPEGKLLAHLDKGKIIK